MNKIKESLKINVYTVLKIIISFAFAITAFLDAGLMYVDDIFATADKIFFLPYGMKNVLHGVLAFVIAFVLLTVFEYIQKKFHITYCKEARKTTRRDYIVWLLIFVGLIIAWLPYLLSYFPGGMYPDTATCVGQARNGVYNNQQPVLYSLILKLCLILAGEMNMIILFSILQTIFMAGCYSYIIYRLYLHNVNKPVLIAIFAYFALFNLVPLYVVSLWKDSLFSVTLLMYIFTLTEALLLSDRKPTTCETVKIIIWMLLTMFLRNNGIYVMILTAIVLAFIFRKTLIKDHRAFFISTFVALVFTYIIQGPVFSKLNMNGPFVENLGVLQQQIAYVQVIGGEMTPEQEAFISQICPLDIMKDSYRPFDVDTIKWSASYNNEFLEANKGQFMKVWAQMIKSNPKLYIDAYLYITLGYWDPFKQSSVSYVNTDMWPDLRDIEFFRQYDVIEKAFGKSARYTLTPKTLISSAAFLFAVLALFILAINKRDKSALAFVPALTAYLTVFMATPLAFALRYVYIVVIALPIFILYAYINSDK